MTHQDLLILLIFMLLYDSTKLVENKIGPEKKVI